MNSIEEKLWNYIDGACTPAEQEAIRLLIAQEEQYKLKYMELLALNSELTAMELDEPPMAFTYNVMEGIRKENALKPLKAAIDKRIIRGIGLFFVVTISVILFFAISQVQFGSGGVSSPLFKFALPDLSKALNGPLMQVFWFSDIVLALYLADNYLRKKRLTKTDISVQAGGQQN